MSNAAVPLTLLTRRPDPARAPVADAKGCASSACGAPATGLDPAIAAKVATHPCYSQDAHQYYARMHIPVAPGCNIQCNYCNRKFDCANESRPGVTSTLLSPEAALAKVKHVASKVPAMSVVGIAGPGEPLANAQRTLGTLELIARDCPDITLCLSTNGLTLIDHVDRIAALGVDHVTVTVNMTDPEVGERIYPWIAFRGKRYTGRAAAAVLSERQLEGIAALRDRGILCKVNSVMIPGVNDEHLVDVSRTVRGLGAFLHNVMPLVSAPEHGTYFGLTGRRGPTPQELAALQDRCEELAGDGSAMAMGLMRHCRQCRADAVGLLGEDRGEEFADRPPAVDSPEYDRATDRATEYDRATDRATEYDLATDRATEYDRVTDRATEYDLATRQETHARIEERRAAGRADREAAGITTAASATPADTVLVAVATSGGGVVNQHFGHADEFWVYEGGPRFARLVGTRSVARYCTGPSECGDAETSLERTVEMLSDCAAVLCSRVGAGPRRKLAAVGVEAVEVYDVIEKAVARTAADLLARRWEETA